MLLPVLAPGGDRLGAAILEAALLIILITPFLWRFMVRPLRRTAMVENVRAATLVENAVDGIILINEQGLIESVNPAAERTFGYKAEGVLGKPVALLMTERYRTALQAGLERVGSRGESRIIGKTVEVHGLRKDGSEFPLELSLAR